MSTDYQHVGRGAVLVPQNGKIEIAGRLLGSYLIERDVDDAIRPELDRFDAQQARQQVLLGRFSAVSPAAVAYEGMTALAGTGSRRQARFEAQTVAHHEAWKRFFFPRIDARHALTPAAFDRIPAFMWHEEPAGLVRGHAARAVLQLLVPSLLLFGLAAWRLRRFSVA